MKNRVCYFLNIKMEKILAISHLKIDWRKFKYQSKNIALIVNKEDPHLPHKGSTINAALTRNFTINENFGYG
jgi:hypothetical protein